ncbi:Acyltransferase family protein [Poriferisphaera corsica]|uniref:Acyltransferase family protein n=1 Tax=Poriferisphaera corsica TaxID=2528020 RepID=A0A517YXL4_9BACT|nr:acyltransferase [Poriferisphaera corsica]QDU34963.1 Acyltransferase family protein [Poriferisphaera corsica]
MPETVAATPANIPTTSTATKSLTINIVRAIGALVVLIHHANGYFLRAEPTYDTAWQGISRVTTTYGWTGVTLFFVISGLCIHLPQARSQATKLNLKKYTIRRLVRLYPTYFIVCFGLIGMLMLNNQFQGGIKSIIGHVFLWYNEFNPVKGESYSVGPFWSLAAEIHLYFLYAICYPLIVRLGVKRVTQVTLGVTIIYYVAHHFLFLSGSELPSYIQPRDFAVARFGEWMLGAYLAELWCTKKLSYQTLPLIKNSKQLLILSIGLIAVPIALSEIWRDQFYVYIINIPIAIASFYLIAYLLIREDENRGASRKGLKHFTVHLLDKIGDRSYSLYLIHLAVISIVGRIIFTKVLKIQDIDAYAGSFSLFAVTILGIAVSFLLTELLYQLVEKPSHKLARRLTRPTK